jgi:predicted nucleic acid-binding protein
MVFVLDSSVALAWLLPDEANPSADALADRLTQQAALVPAIWPLEVGNALLMAQRRSRIKDDDLLRLAATLLALPIQVDQSPSARALVAVLELAKQHGLTTYDAAYIELAQRRSLPLATLDAKLRQACVATKVSVLP